jgi:hypothetical protein
VSLLDDAARVESLTVLSGFRTDFYRCLTARADALFELTDALLCTDGPVKTLVDLALAPEHRRSHGMLYDGLGCGRIDVDRLRVTLAGLPLPRAADGRIVLGVDVSPWLRSAAPTSAERLFCHVYGRAKNQSQLIPGWPYWVVAALEAGRTCWTAVLDAVRLGPADDATAVTACQLRAVVGRLITARHWRPGDPDILIVCDAGYDVTRLALVLADLPVELLGRLRCDRVLRLPAPPRRHRAGGGRPPRHGPEFALDNPATWPQPQTTTTTQTSRYGTAAASSWDRLHPRLTHRTCWLDHQGELPIIQGTLLRLQVDHLPGDRDPKPLWLWSSRTGITPPHTWTGSGRRSCVGLILSTPSGCSSRAWAGPAPSCAPPRPLTAGPGWSSPATPSSAWPAPSPTTCAAPGRSPRSRAVSPPPGSAAGFGTCMRRPPCQPVHQNPASPALDAHPGPGTTSPRHTTRSARPSKETSHSQQGSNERVKRQA